MTEPGEVFTPKNYAEWLVRKYYSFGLNNPAQSFSWYECKEFALIAINSIYDSTRMLVSHYIKSNGVKAYMDIELSKNLTLTYWREVKQEIEKL
jgi:hypothetical protein